MVTSIKPATHAELKIMASTGASRQQASKWAANDKRGLLDTFWSPSWGGWMRQVSFNFVAIFGVLTLFGEVSGVQFLVVAAIWAASLAFMRLTRTLRRLLLVQLHYTK